MLAAGSLSPTSSSTSASSRGTSIGLVRYARARGEQRRAHRLGGVGAEHDHRDVGGPRVRLQAREHVLGAEVR
jgi:hypothetical protein